MTEFTISIEEDKFGPFLDLIKDLEYANITKLDGKKVSKKLVQFLQDTRSGLKEAELHRRGEIELQDAREFFLELKKEKELQELKKLKVAQVG